MTALKVDPARGSAREVSTSELRRKLQALRIETIAESEIPAPNPSPPVAPRTVLVMMGLVLAASLGTNLVLLNDRSPARAAVRVESDSTVKTPPTSTAEKERIAASGNLRPVRQATVSAEATGRLVELRFEEGDEVKAGQVLARLDGTVPTAATTLARAQHEAALAALRTSEAGFARASAEAKRIAVLHEKGFASDAARDLAQEGIAAAASQVSQRRAEAAAAAAAVSRQASVEGQYVIRAPFDGVIVSRNAQLGEIVSPVSAGGGFTRSGVYTVADLSRVEVEARIGESELNRVKPGVAATVTFEAYPDRPLPAKVTAIAPSAERDRGAVPVRIQIDAEPNLRLLPQMAAQVEINAR